MNVCQTDRLPLISPDARAGVYSGAQHAVDTIHQQFHRRIRIVDSCDRAHFLSAALHASIHPVDPGAAHDRAGIRNDAGSVRASMPHACKIDHVRFDNLAKPDAERHRAHRESALAHARRVNGSRARGERVHVVEAARSRRLDPIGSADRRRGIHVAQARCPHELGIDEHRAQLQDRVVDAHDAVVVLAGIAARSHVHAPQQLPYDALHVDIIAEGP